MHGKILNGGIKKKHIMNEVWKDVLSYEGCYQVSNVGRVRSVDKKVKHNYGGIAIKRGRFLKSWLKRY